MVKWAFWRDWQCWGLRRFGWELKREIPWLAFLAFVGGLGVHHLHGSGAYAALCQWLSANDAVIGALLLGSALSQLVVFALRDLAAALAALDPIPGSPNRWPQRFLGFTESIGYAVAFAAVEPSQVVTGAGAWLAFKQLGTWQRGTTASDQHKPADQDERRRRFYVFLFANALQVGFGAATGAALKWALG